MPRSIALPGTGETVRAYPALVDEGDGVAVRAFETPGAQAAAMHAGTRALLRFAVPSPLRTVQRRLSSSAALALAGAPHGGAAAILDDMAPVGNLRFEFVSSPGFSTAATSAVPHNALHDARALREFVLRWQG